MLENFFVLLQNIIFHTAMVDNSFPEPLGAEREKTLLLRWWDGDIEARDDLLKHNMRLVVHVAKKYNNYPDPEELISVGSIGLLKAINTYTSGKGTQLATYAARCIENEILMVLRANRKSKNNKSLFEPISVDRDGNDITLIDLIATDTDSVYDSVENTLLSEKLDSIIANALTQREADIIICRYGIHNHPELTQIEIAKRFKISRSYVSRIEKRALEKMRDYLENNNLLL